MNDTFLNPVTGLRETPHPFYGVPLVHQRGLGSVRLAGNVRAVHSVPTESGRTLDFFGQLRKSEELFISFQSANSEINNFYPRFERVSSLRSAAQSFLAFADPTLQLNSELKLAWFLGGPGWDPLDEVDTIIRSAIGRTGARRLIFVGGSGGGYAALRASARHPGSLAFVQSPQTIIKNYVESVVTAYFSTVWAAFPQSSLIDAFPDRFDMSRHYSKTRPANYVYYMQSDKDFEHLEKHYAPFRAVHRVSEPAGSVDTSGRRFFAPYPAEKPNHAFPSGQEFDFHLRQALAFYRSKVQEA